MACYYTVERTFQKPKHFVAAYMAFIYVWWHNLQMTHSSEGMFIMVLDQKISISASRFIAFLSWYIV